MSTTPSTSSQSGWTLSMAIASTSDTSALTTKETKVLTLPMPNIPTPLEVLAHMQEAAQKGQLSVKGVIVKSPTKVNQVILGSASVMAMLGSLKKMTKAQREITEANREISRNFAYGMKDLKAAP